MMRPGRFSFQCRTIVSGFLTSAYFELELELMQPHMAQKPVLRGEVGCACVAGGHMPIGIFQKPVITLDHSTRNNSN